MALSSQQKRVGLQIGLGLVIIVLCYVLYVSITGPYQEVLAQERETEQTRSRMGLARTALIRYREQTQRFPRTLDSLVMYVEQNQELRSELDSLYAGENFAPDSVIHSPRTGKEFQYQVSPDTARVDIYRLKDPDSEDQIGTTRLDVTEVNAASWE